MAVWIWDPKFDDYQRFLLETRDLDCCNPGFRKIEAQDLVIIHFPLLKEDRSLDFPVTLLRRLEGVSAPSLLKQMNNLVSGEGVPDIINRIGSPARARARIKTWRIAPKYFSMWLGMLSGDWERVRNPKPGYNYGCLITIIGGGCSWGATDGQIMLLPFSEIPDRVNMCFITSGNSPARITYIRHPMRGKSSWPCYGPQEYDLLIEYHQPISTDTHNPRELMEDLSSVIAKMGQRQNRGSGETTTTDRPSISENGKEGGGGGEAEAEAEAQAGGGESIKEVTTEIEGPDGMPSTEPTFTPDRRSISSNHSEHL